jgi:hypothetical protein
MFEIPRIDQDCLTQNSACPPNCSMKQSSQPSSYNRQSGQIQTRFTLHQCCGSGDIYSGFRIQFFLSQIPDPSSRTYRVTDPGSRIPDLDVFPSQIRIPEHGVIKDPGSGFKHCFAQGKFREPHSENSLGNFLI